MHAVALQSASVVHAFPLFTPWKHTAGVTLPVGVPTGADVVNPKIVGSGVPHEHAVCGTHWQLLLHICPPPQPPPQGGSHCSVPPTNPSPQYGRVVVVLVLVVEVDVVVVVVGGP